MLQKNALACTASWQDALKIVLRAATHSLASGTARPSADAEVLVLANWFLTNSRATSRGNRVVKFRALRGILTRFNCEFEHPGKGNRVNISRSVPRSGMFSRKRVLTTQIAYRNEGTDVETNTIDKVRLELELDEEHGCDSHAFYGKDVAVVDEVVAQYQHTLDRLARL
jgi:hypothetical protein